MRSGKCRGYGSVWSDCRHQGLRTIAAHCGVDRKTVRRYVEAAQAAGLTRDDSAEALDDSLIGAVAEAVRPVRPHGHGASWERLTPFEERIRVWVAGDGEHPPLTITKIEVLLARQGCMVPYRTLHRFASQRCGFGRKNNTTVRVADGDPGIECQIDFGYLGMLTDADNGRRRKVYALIFTAVFSRHMFVWLTRQSSKRSGRPPIRPLNSHNHGSKRRGQINPVLESGL